MPGDQLNEFMVHIPSVAELGADGDPFMLHIYAALAESRWYLSTRRIALFGRFWRARHPPRYAALNQTSSLRFPLILAPPKSGQSVMRRMAPIE
jgi:hypothetical protein